MSGVLLQVVAVALAQSGAMNLAQRIPPATGPFAVGRVEVHWIDSSRTEPFLPAVSARREVLVYVWYPAEAIPAAPLAEYVPHYPRIAGALGDSAMDAEFGSSRSAIASGAIRSHSIANAPLKRVGRPFPVLVFSHGFGESSLTYSAQLEDLASHGYVVFGIEHPFDAYAVVLSPNRIERFAAARWDSARARPGGAMAYQLAQVPLRAADVRFALDQLSHLRAIPGVAGSAGALDLGRIGAFGHSLGGMAAANACRLDARIRACMNQDADDDGRPFDGGPAALPIKQPFLFFETGHSIYVSPRTPPPTEGALTSMKLNRSQYDSITSLYQRNQDVALASLPGGAIRIMAEAEDFTHRTFIDLKVLQAGDSTAVLHQTAYLQLIRNYTRAFFDEMLLGGRVSLLDRDGQIDSVVTIGHFRPKG